MKTKTLVCDLSNSAFTNSSHPLARLSMAFHKREVWAYFLSPTCRCGTHSESGGYSQSPPDGGQKILIFLFIWVQATYQQNSGWSPEEHPRFKEWRRLSGLHEAIVRAVPTLGRELGTCRWQQSSGESFRSSFRIFSEEEMFAREEPEGCSLH